MDQDDVLSKISSENTTAHELNAASRFYRTAKNLSRLLDEVREHFPDASYYAASGSLSLLLGESHNKHDQPQQELLAHAAPDLRVEGGDW
ncbi:Uncharacterised protein [Klebsiella pneumoniae]|uniref:hypothetical protein n=1 Tax=Klebsiella pneumoniae TaxID=573 RepID=UPI0009CFD36C|nr:hypothetical protein [Klebsiella pneumoniae]SLX23930.1 Uncharacterised protein [Klebsiella pneumoniae]